MALTIPVESIELGAYKVEDLLRLRDRVIKRLPATTIEDIDLTQELVLRYIAAKELLDDIAGYREDIPLNQIAQANNSLVSMMKELALQQKQLFDTTRLQRLEKALAKALVKFPELYDAFFDAYEAEAHKQGIDT